MLPARPATWGGSVKKLSPFCSVFVVWVVSLKPFLQVSIRTPWHSNLDLRPMRKFSSFCFVFVVWIVSLKPFLQVSVRTPRHSELHIISHVLARSPCGTLIISMYMKLRQIPSSRTTRRHDCDARSRRLWAAQCHPEVWVVLILVRSRGLPLAR